MKNQLLNFLQCLTIFYFFVHFDVKGSSLLQLISPGQDSTLKWIEWKGRPDKPKIVFISGDEEYRSEESLVQLAKILNVNHGFNCTILFAQDPNSPGIIDPNYQNNIPGLNKLADADLMVMLIRFRALPDNQMQFIDDYLKSGKPILGMRTATHAFNFDECSFKSSYEHYGNYYLFKTVWQGGFGRLILGEKWIAHHGAHGQQSTLGIVAETSRNHPIFNGIIPGTIWGATDVYAIRLPMSDTVIPLLFGQVTERNGPYDKKDLFFGMRPSDSEPAGMVKRINKRGDTITIDLNAPMMPVAWIKSYRIPGGRTGKVFATTMGASTDLVAEGTRRMLVNAAYWCLGIKVPEDANVALIGNYKPSQYGFFDNAYWKDRALKISELDKLIE
jgi:hypothetical protein